MNLFGEFLIPCFDAKKSTQDGLTPLHCAAATKGSFGMCEVLLNHNPALLDAATKVSRKYSI
jgi:hypothetical protein